jgi:hypothetical protein
VLSSAQLAGRLGGRIDRVTARHRRASQRPR